MKVILDIMYLDQPCSFASLIPKPQTSHTMLEYTFVTCKERIQKGEDRKRELLFDVDKAAVDKLVEKQVHVVDGSEVIFRRLDTHLNSGIIELCLLREYCELYHYRRTFFDNSLPVLKGAWFTNSFCRDVITYQITHNFDQILDIVCSNKSKTEPPMGLFFDSDGTMTRSARYRIDNIQILFHLREKVLWTGYFLTETFLPGANLRFGDIAHIILEHHRLGTKRLEELAMQTVLRNNIELDCASRAVKDNATNGFYNPDCDIPENLTEDGKELFEQLKSVYNKIRNSSKHISKIG